VQPTWCFHLHCWQDWQAAEKDHKAIPPLIAVCVVAGTQ
jgi:hypothetical protein